MKNWRQKGVTHSSTRGNKKYNISPTDQYLFIKYLCIN